MAVAHKHPKGRGPEKKHEKVRTSLGTPKHVLHLVWSDSDISTSINIALKLARLGKFMAIIKAIRKAEH